MNENESLEKDDEITREQAMTSGPIKAARWTLRTTAAREVSWMLTGKVIHNDRMDEYFRMCAFVYLHTAPTPEISAVITSEDKFTEAVYDWMATNNPSRLDIDSMLPAYSQRVGEWFASYSTLAESGPSSGN